MPAVGRPGRVLAAAPALGDLPDLVGGQVGDVPQDESLCGRGSLSLDPEHVDAENIGEHKRCSGFIFVIT